MLMRKWALGPNSARTSEFYVVIKIETICNQVNATYSQNEIQIQNCFALHRSGEFKIQAVSTIYVRIVTNIARAVLNLNATVSDFKLAPDRFTFLFGRVRLELIQSFAAACGAYRCGTVIANQTFIFEPSTFVVQHCIHLFRAWNRTRPIALRGGQVAVTAAFHFPRRVIEWILQTSRWQLCSSCPICGSNDLFAPIWSIVFRCGPWSICEII